MAVGFDNATSAQGNPLTSQSYALPTIAAGETIGLLVAWQPTGAVTISGAGTWTHQGSDGLIAAQIQLGFWTALSATGSESGQNVTINVAAQEKFAAIAFSYSGVDTGTPLLSGPTYATFTTSNTTSATSPSVTPSPGSWTLSGYASKSSTNASYTTPSGLTLRQSVFGSGGGAIDLSLFDTNGPVTSGGGQTSTMGTATGNKIAFTIVLKTGIAAVNLSTTQGHAATLTRGASLAKTTTAARSSVVIRQPGITRTATPQARSASLVRQPGIVRAASQGTTSSLARSAAITQAIAQIHAPKALGKVVSLTEPTAIQGHAAALLIAKPLVLSTTISRSSVLIRQPQLARTAAQGTTGTIGKAVSLTRTVSQPRTPTVTKSLARTLAAAVSRTASLLRGYARTLTATQAHSATLTRQAGLTRSTTQGRTATQSNVHVLPDPTFSHGITKVGLPYSGATRFIVTDPGTGYVSTGKPGRLVTPDNGASRVTTPDTGATSVTTPGNGKTFVTTPDNGAGKAVVT